MSLLADSARGLEFLASKGVRWLRMFCLECRSFHSAVLLPSWQDLATHHGSVGASKRDLLEHLGLRRNSQGALLSRDTIDTCLEADGVAPATRAVATQVYCALARRLWLCALQRGGVPVVGPPRARRGLPCAREPCRACLLLRGAHSLIVGCPLCLFMFWSCDARMWIACCIGRDSPALQSDVWALGVVMWEVVSGAVPYAQFPPSTLPELVCEQGYRLPKVRFSPLVPCAVYRNVSYRFQSHWIFVFLHSRRCSHPPARPASISSWPLPGRPAWRQGR